MRRTVVAVALTVSLSACLHIEGSGVLKEESRSPGEFTKVSISGGLKAEIAGGAELSVVVSGDDNIVAVVETGVSGETLEVHPEPGVSFNESQPLIVRVTLPSLAGLEASGASRVAARGINGRQVSLEASGASSICATGWADALEIDASGASRVHAGELASNQARVEASGASLIEVRADRAIEAEASGGSEVRVGGTARVQEKASGGSKITRLE